RIDEFISLSSNQSSGSPDVQHLAFCFLAARKFSVAQALELYHNYQVMLSREGVSQRIDPFDEDVRQELLSGKFVILNDHEVSGARVAQFFVRLHRTNNSGNRSLLQSILFQLDAALKKEAASRSGLVFIYDMTDAKFANIDCSFGIKLFKLLQ
ncbi:tyrosine-protein phosphatase non-receptor type 9, partial [Paragonimus westermani]